MKKWVHGEAVYQIMVGTKAIEGKIWISDAQVSNVDLLLLWSTSWCKGTMVRGHATFLQKQHHHHILHQIHLSPGWRGSWHRLTHEVRGARTAENFHEKKKGETKSRLRPVTVKWGWCHSEETEFCGLFNELPLSNKDAAASADRGRGDLTGWASCELSMVLKASHQPCR